MDTRLHSKCTNTVFAAAMLSVLSGAAGAQAPPWSTSGNNINPGDFLGTKDNNPNPLVIKTFNTERLRVDANGDVHIGTSNPGGTVLTKLWLKSGFDTEVLRFGWSDIDYHFLSTSFHGQKPRNNYLGFNIEYNSNDIRRVLTLVGDGTVGIGTMDPASMLEVQGTSDKAGISGIGPNVGIYAHNTAKGNDAYLGSLCCAGDFHGDVNVIGKTVTQVLEITGGSDLAEPFAMDREAVIQPGMVVAIDPAHPGQLRLAEHAYDRTVAGIVSGANGIKPGLTMTSDHAAVPSRPVSLSGRVYVWADAAHDPIQPGDLLTTADTPGHAMKVEDYTRAQGAILGKAMSALPAGTGLVLVLVSLQ